MSLPPKRAAVPALRFRTKLALAFGATILLVAALAAFLCYRVAVDSLTREFGEKLKTLAASAAMEIDGDAFSTLREPAQMGSPAYQHIQDRLRRLRRANSHLRLRYLYTMAPAEKPGIWRYVVDSQEEGSPGFSALGDTEDYTGGDVIVDARNGVAADRQVKHYPGWGPLLTAAAPIRSRSGQVVGVVGVDAPAEAVAQAKAGILWTSLGVFLFGVLCSTAVSWLIARQVTRPLDALMAGARAVGEGDLEYRVVVRNRDELGEMADAFNQMTRGLRERELYKEQFGRYVSRQIADKILADPEKVFWEGERRRATILFSDIRGFTSMSEHMPPEEVLARLNEYLGLMIQIVFEYDGTLDKFIGDAIMAVFGAPKSFGDDEERAVRAALAMREEVERLRLRWQQEGVPAFRIGIGINTGEVVVGNIGSDARLEYGAIGDHVNLASRLEGLNKEYGTDILISESTFHAVQDRFACRWIDRVSVKGRERPVDVFELLGPRE